MTLHTRQYREHLASATYHMPEPDAIHPTGLLRCGTKFLHYVRVSIKGESKDLAVLCDLPGFAGIGKLVRSQIRGAVIQEWSLQEVR